MYNLFGFLLLLFFTSCEEEKKPSVELSVTPSVQNVVALGESKSFSVLSGTDWFARSSASWANIVNAKGTGSSDPSSMVINCVENESLEIRSAEITVTNLDGETETVSIIQEAGDGTETERGIRTAEDLVGFAKAVNGEGSIARYLVNDRVLLRNDIDASSIAEWIPVGSKEYPLTYSIDGNGYTIKNVNWTIDTDKYPNAGFVGYARSISIDNLVFGVKGNTVILSGSNPKSVCAGGIIGNAVNVKMTRTTNNVSLKYTGKSQAGENLIIGGLAGRANLSCEIGNELSRFKCQNNGNITVEVAAREGGIVGYNNGTIKNCTNYGTISGPVSGNLGPGWLCSINKNKASVVSNFGYGYVNSTPAMLKNSMMNYEEGYDIAGNTVDWTLDAYYDWTEVEKRQLHSGLVYHHYNCDNVPRHVHVLDIDLSDPGIELTAAYAGEMVPNPNYNGDHNNGFNLRETLSMVCERRISEGQKILAGTNGGFFGSHYGLSRGFHVEEGEIVYIPAPFVIKGLPAQVYALTVFSDGTASLGAKKFTGKIRVGGREYDYQTVNDTTMHHVTPTETPINLYNWRYVRQPYASRPDIINELADDVLYIICEYTNGPMQVNCGYATAKVIDVIDGRAGKITPLYLTDKNQVGIAVSGSSYYELSPVKKGDTIELKCDVSIDGDASKPIRTLISSKNQYMANGKDNKSDSYGDDTEVPKTLVVLSQDCTKVWLVVVDGRQGWYSTGVTGYEMYRIGEKLGGWWVTGLDGGGSSSMWAWDPSKNKGGTVSNIGYDERSCLNYVIVREKQ